MLGFRKEDHQTYTPTLQPKNLLAPRRGQVGPDEMPQNDAPYAGSHIFIGFFKVRAGITDKTGLDILLN